VPEEWTRLRSLAQPLFLVSTPDASNINEFAVCCVETKREMG